MEGYGFDQVLAAVDEPGAVGSANVLAADGYEVTADIHEPLQLFGRESHARGVHDDRDAVTVRGPYKFFEGREAHARRLGGFETFTFCRVMRPDDYPLKPLNYRPLDRFWRKRGYRPVEGLLAEYAWKDIGQSEETTKQLQFWTKPL